MATPFEQLAASLLGGDTQKLIAAENPYYQLGSVPQIFTQSLQATPVKDSRDMWGRSIAASLSGLLGAGLQAFGNKYQNTLTDRYLNSFSTGEDEGLSPGLFGAAQRQRNLAGLFQQAREQEILDAERLNSAKYQNEFKKKLLASALADPIAFENALPTIQQLFSSELGKPATPGSMGEAAAAPVVAEPSAATAISKEAVASSMPDGDTFVVGETPAEDWTAKLPIKPLEDRKAEKFQYYRRQGFTPTKASDQVTKDFSAEMRQEETTDKQIMENLAKAKDLEALSSAVSGALGEDIYTGIGSGAVSTVKSIEAAIRGPDSHAARDASAYDMLKSIRAKVMGLNRVVGSGSTSDFEARQYILGGPGADKQYLTNQEMLRRMDEVVQFNRDYADFVDAVRGLGGTVRDANRLWSQYEKAQPLWTKDGASLKRNDKRLSYQDYFSGVAPYAAPEGIADKPITAAPPATPAAGGETKEQFIARRKAELMAGK